MEKSVTSAAIVPRRPRQNVSATNANNQDTFSPPARLESDMINQPIHGFGAYTSSGLDDGMDSSSLFVHWIPLASICGIGASIPAGHRIFLFLYDLSRLSLHLASIITAFERTLSVILFPDVREMDLHLSTLHEWAQICTLVSGWCLHKSSATLIQDMKRPSTMLP